MQGQEGDSLFVVVEGTVEVLLRREDGTEVHLGTRPHGTVLGEMSLLTGEPRSATVRAVDGALVYEVGRRQCEPILAARPELVEALQSAMATRLRTQDETLERYDAARSRHGVPRPLREELQRVGAGGVGAEALDVARAPAAGSSLRLRQRDAVLGRQRRPRRRAQAKVRSAAVKRSPHEVAAAVGEALGDRVELGQHRGAVVVERRPSARARARPARGERVEPRAAPGPPRPGRPALL